MTITLLGEVAIDGTGAHLSPRDRVVLGALSIRPGRSVPASVLAGALWPDEPPPSAAKIVQGCIVRLRRALGADAIATTADGYRLTLPADEIDACRFERLAIRSRELLEAGEHDRAAHTGRLALATWRGPALSDLDGWESARAEASRLDALRLETEDIVLESTLLMGDHRRLLSEADARVGESPRRERRWELLALAEYRSGRQADALRTLARAGRTLRQESGLEPGPGLRALELAILRQDPSLTGEATAQLGEDVCPYPGLLAYGVDDADVFFGRDADVAQCLRLLEQTGVVAVVGPSGCGKTSLVRAGIAAAVARSGRNVEIITPGAHPISSLPGEDGDDPPACLVVDQCEEAITRCADAYERAAFFAELAERAGRRPLVLALRADFVGEVSTDRSFARIIERGLHLLGPLSADDLAAAIEGPARQAGLRFEPGLVDLLHHEVDGSAGSLPLLAHALRATWEHREGRALTVDGYRRTGGIRGAVAQTAEAVYQAATEEHRPLLRDLLLRLVAPSPLGAPYRVRVPYTAAAFGPIRAALVERLVEARLLTRDGDSLELAHESLATAWPRLRTWIDDDIDGLRIRRHLAVASEDWERLGRPDSELYRGVRLSSVVDWARRVRPDLVPVERAFLAASETRSLAERRDAEVHLREEARTNRRLRQLVVGAAVLVVISLVAGVLAVRQATRADRAAAAADARRVAAQAGASSARDRSLLLAVEAVRLDDSLDARASLLAAVARDPLLIRSVRTNQRLSTVAASPDGERVAIGGPSGPVLVYHAGTLEPTARVNVPATLVRFSPDSTRLAIVRAPGSDDDVDPIVIVDADGETIEPSPQDAPSNEATDVAFSPDGRVLAATFALGLAAPTSSTLAIWSAESPAEPLISVELAGTHASLALSPDGATAVVGTRRSGGYARWMSVVDLGTGAVVREEELRATPTEISPDGARVAAVDEHDAIVYDLETLTELVRLETHSELMPGGWFAPDGRELVTAAVDGTATIWNVQPSLGPVPDGGRTTRRQVELQGHGGRVVEAAYSPDGSTLYTVSIDQTMLVWDLAGDRRFASSSAGDRPPERRTPTVRETAAGIEVYEAGTRAAAGGPVPVGGDVRRVFASADSRRGVALLADGTIALLDFVDGRIHGLLRVAWRPDWAAFSPDGHRLAVTGRDGEVGLVDVDHVRWVAPPTVSARGGSTVDWAPDGETFVSGSDDASVGLWDATTGTLIGTVTLGDEAGPVRPVFDGTDVVVDTGIGRVYRFDSRSEAWAEFACSVAGRALTRDEWSDTFGDAPHRDTCRDQ